jgi:chlorophyll(ide) b reductase
VHRCEKKVERKRKVEKFKGNGSWDSLKSGFLGFSKLGFLSKDEYNQKVENLEMVFSSVAVQIARYIVTMTSTGAILLIGFQLSGGDSSMNSLVWYSWLGGIIIGTMTGANMVLEDHYRAGPRNVVITGSTRGLGKALAREFLLSGDRVIVTSRSSESVDMTVKELEQNLKEIMSNASESARKKLSDAKVVGIACDVCKPEDVEKLSNFAVKELGSINIWINNAGTNKGFRPLLEFTEEDITQIVSTNLIGSILCTRGAMDVMSRQHSGGHIFNMDGAGSGGSSTPLTAVYGSTKCGLRQFHGSIVKESQKTNVGLHTASPGMVLTELLLRYAYTLSLRPRTECSGVLLKQPFIWQWFEH